MTTSSGIVIKIGGRNTAQVAKDMADKICHLLELPQRMDELSAGAISRAREFHLPRRVKEFYDLAATFVASDFNFMPNALPTSSSDPALIPLLWPKPNRGSFSDFYRTRNQLVSLTRS